LRLSAVGEVVGPVLPVGVGLTVGVGVGVGVPVDGVGVGDEEATGPLPPGPGPVSAQPVSRAAQVAAAATPHLAPSAERSAGA
jgi:hypothetical protein